MNNKPCVPQSKSHCDRDQVKPDIILPNGRRLRHLPGPDVRQYRMGAIKQLPNNRFAIVNLNFDTSVIIDEHIRTFGRLQDAVAWIDYLTESVLAAFFDDSDPVKPTIEPQSANSERQITPLQQYRKRSDIVITL